MSSGKRIRPFAGLAVAIAIAIGAGAVVNSSSSSGASAATNTPMFGQPGAQNNQTVVGQVPQNWHSGSGTIITGAAADKAKAVALAKYPGGTVNRVLKLSDGSYAVHMIKISWPHHVFVSTDFTVTGAIG